MQLDPWPEGNGLKQVGDNTTMVLGPIIPPTGPARMFAKVAQLFS